METTVVQKSLVVNDKGEILILRRSKTDPRRPLQWDLPGGMLEAAEGMIEGVEREIIEETGLKVTGTHVIYSKTEFRIWNGGANEGSVVFLLYASHTDAADVTISHEHSEYDWKTIEDALPLFEYPLHLEYLQYVLKHKVAL